MRVDWRCRLEKGTKHCTWTITDALPFNYLWWQANYGWHSVEAYFHDGARSVSLSLCSIMMADTLIMYSNNHIAFDIPDLYDHNWMTLCWCWFSEWGRWHAALHFADKASQYCIYEWPQLIASQITHDAKAKIVYAALMLILPCAYSPYIVI